MSFKTTLFAALLAGLPLAATAEDMSHGDHMMIVEHGALRISDAYARVASPVAKAGAAFLTIENIGSIDDQLIAAQSDVAQRVELHTHTMNSEGVMQMGKVEGGFAIPASDSHALARGGDHVMFMGLNNRWTHGDKIEVTLTFEKAGDVTLTIPVDLERQPGQMAHGADH